MFDLTVCVIRWRENTITKVIIFRPQKQFFADDVFTTFQQNEQTRARARSDACFSFQKNFFSHFRPFSGKNQADN